MYDIVFVLDSSNVVGPVNFDLVKSFVSQFVTRLNIGTNLNRVAVISFGDNVERTFYLNQYTNVNDLVNGILSVRYLGGGSNLAEAFRQTRTDVLSGFVSYLVTIGFPKKTGDYHMRHIMPCL